MFRINPNRDRMRGCLFRSLLVVAVVSVLLAAMAIASSPVKIIPVGISIIEGTKSVSTWSDPELTQPVHELIWTEIGRGSNLPFTLYVEHTGIEPLILEIVADRDISEWGRVTVEPATISLQSGEVGIFDMEILVIATAPVGDYYFQLEIVEWVSTGLIGE